MLIIVVKVFIPISSSSPTRTGTEAPEPQKKPISQSRVEDSIVPKTADYSNPLTLPTPSAEASPRKVETNGPLVPHSDGKVHEKSEPKTDTLFPKSDAEIKSATTKRTIVIVNELPPPSVAMYPYATTQVQSVLRPSPKPHHWSPSLPTAWQAEDRAQETLALTVWRNKILQVKPQS